MIILTKHSHRTDQFDKTLSETLLRHFSGDKHIKWWTNAGEWLAGLRDHGPHQVGDLKIGEMNKEIMNWFVDKKLIRAWTLPGHQKAAPALTETKCWDHFCLFFFLNSIVMMSLCLNQWQKHGLQIERNWEMQ